MIRTARLVLAVPLGVAVGIVLIMAISWLQSRTDGDGFTLAERDLSGFTVYAAPRALPDLAFLDEKGGTVGLSDFAGRWVLLNFWATWCDPCVREMPSLGDLARRRGGEDFAVVAVSLDREGETVVAPFYEDLGLESLDIYLDPRRRTTRRLGVEDVPTTYLINPGGKAVGELVGPAQWNGAAAFALIDRFMEAGE